MKSFYFFRAIFVSMILFQLGVLPSQLRGAAGDVDLSFDAGSGVNGTVRAIAVRADGKVLIGGSFTTVKGLACTNVARLNADGSADTTFVAAPVNAVDELLLQADGKVLISGGIRLNPDGTLDNTFSADLGAQPFGGEIYCMALQPDGKVVLGGYFTDLPNEPGSVDPIQRTILTRLNVDGSRDISFTNGYGMYGGPVYSVALEPSGKLLIGGGIVTTVNGTNRYDIARLNANGSVDSSFTPGVRGIVRCIVVQPDGKIIVGGYSVGTGTNVNGLVRLNTNGSRDPTFRPASDPNSSVALLSLQPDGKLLIGGPYFYFNGANPHGVARLNPDGSVDNTFNGFNPGTGAPDNAMAAFALQPDGKLLIGGGFTTVNGVKRERLARLHPNGSLDLTFSPGSTTLLGSPVSSLVLQPDGKVLVGGALTFINGTNRYASARLNADGTMDSSFVAATNFNPDLLAVTRYEDCLPGNYSCDPVAWASTVATQADGKVLVGGIVRTEITGDEVWVHFYRPVLGRFYADGKLDTNFAPVLGGPFDAADYDHYQDVSKVIVQPDGKIIVAGNFTSINGADRPGLARLNTNGTLDLSFAPAIGQNAWISTAAVQPDGKVLIAGHFGNLSGSFPRGIARLNANGSFDSSFHSMITVTNDSSIRSDVQSFALQPDGKILIGGSFTNVNGTNLTSIARLNANGSLDVTFNPGTTKGQSVNSIALQSNGDVLIGGGFLAINGVLRPYVARLYGDSSAPPLNITRSNALMKISWPASAAAFSLQESTNLSPASSWTLVPQPVTTNSGQNSVMVPASSGTRFFRLTSP
jgi:uncharacterized delta-60 repeat protein